MHSCSLYPIPPPKIAMVQLVKAKRVEISRCSAGVLLKSCFVNLAQNADMTGKS